MTDHQLEGAAIVTVITIGLLALCMLTAVALTIRAKNKRKVIADEMTRLETRKNGKHKEHGKEKN